MKVSRLIVDFGNTNWKARSDDVKTEITVPHAMLELDPATWEHINKRSNGKPTADYAEVNGRFYAFGEAAERHGTVVRRQRSTKYTEDYFGVGLAYLAARVFKTDRVLSVFASHAPGDIDYRDDLLEACGDVWQVGIEGDERTFHVLYANTYEEPIGGVMNVMLASDGKHYRNPRINEGRVLAIDIGGGTVDLSSILPDGQIDQSLQISLEMGFNNVYDEFVKAFRVNNAKQLKGLNTLPPDRVRDAIRTGVFKGGGKEIKCEDEANAATFKLLNEVKTAYYTKAGGPIPWDFITLTGGGPVPLYERLCDLLDHQSILKAEDDEFMHLANTRGGLKLLYMYESLGLVKYE